MTHFEETLQRDIERIRSKVRDMAALAVLSLNGAMAALAQKSRQLGYSVILRDQRIDELEKEIDRLCLEFIVRQQPVAGTLRFAYATIKINSELERVGDYAESMARQVLSLEGLEFELPHGRLDEMADTRSRCCTTRSRPSSPRTPRSPSAPWKSRRSIDRLRHAINAELVQLRQEQKIPLEALAPLMTIVNRLERVGDQAKSICQEVLYMCTGEYLKHPGSDVFRVLFVDEHNSCRSQMAEAVGNSLGQPKFVFASAGLERRPIDQTTVNFLGGKGIDVSRHTPKGVDQIPHLDQYQILVALAKEAQRVFPPPPTKAVCLDWSIRDPSTVHGTAEEVRAAYEETFQFLHGHIHDLVEAILGDSIE